MQPMTNLERLSPRDFEPGELSELRRMLARRYANVFPEDAVETHLRDYVGFPFAGQMVPIVSRLTPPGGRILDMGCGFGSFPLLMRHQGYDALGIDSCADEIAWARRRAAKTLPQAEADAMFLQGDAADPGLPDESLDAVTCWNLLEHVPDESRLADAAFRLLKPGGSLYLICPNYFAFRNEAHYLVPWRPLLSRRAAAERLRTLGKDPAFFLESIYQRSNWGVLYALHRSGFRIWDLFEDVRLDLRWDNLPHLAGDFRRALRFYNPLKDSVILRATKEIAL